MKTRLIALTGLAGSGKNTVAAMLGGHEVSFAEPLKRFCREVFDFSAEQLNGPSEARNRPDPRYTRADGQALTPRFALQTLGTEWGRACYPEVWTRLGIRRALDYLAANPEGLAVITDCRFLNEATAVRQVGGEVWRVERPGQGLTGTASLHSSEAEVMSDAMTELVSVRLGNGGSLDDLSWVVSCQRAAWERR